MTFKHLIFFVSALASASAAWSQPSDESDKNQIEFRVLGWNRDHLDMFYELKGKPQPLRLIQGAPSPAQRYTGPATLTFYIPAPAGAASPKQPLVTVTLNPPPRKNLVVIWLAKTGVYEAAVLADEPDRPSPGHLRLVNLSGRELLLQCNKDEPLPLAPGAERITSAQADGVGVKIAMQAKRNANWELVLMNGITVRPKDRVTVFVADPSRLARTLESEASNSPPSPDTLSLFMIRDRSPAP